MKALISGCFASLVLFLSVPSQGQIVSDFSLNDEGWTITDVSGTNPQTVIYNSTGGNPGGYVSFTTSSNLGFFWKAPAKFLGEHCLDGYGQNLRFDLQISAAGVINSSSPPYGSLRLTGGGISITLALTPPAITPGWTSYSVRLDETTAWRNNVTSGTLSTRADIITAISNLNKIEIVAQAQAAADPEVRIDNIILEQASLGTRPTIATFSPATGIPGITDVTITGTGFDATPASNVVYFGGAQGAVSAASSTQLTVRVPSGAKYSDIIVVNKTTGRAASTISRFLPRFDNNKDYGGLIIRASLAPPAMIPAANYRGWVEAADIDGDGRNDLIVSEATLRTFTVARNTATVGSISAASFQTPVSFSLGTTDSKGFLATGDFDGDGKLDVAVSSATNLGYASVSVFRNTSTPGSISFQAPVPLTGYSYSDGPLAVADMDGDGRPEILCVFNNSCGTNQMYIFPNRSTPGLIDFCAYTGFPVYSCGGSLTVADLDGDKKPEVIVEAGQVSVFRNTSTPGNVTMAPAFLLASNAGGSPVIADLDNDGKNDIAWQNNTSKIEIHKNIYSGGAFDVTGFSAAILVEATLNNVSGVIAGDINGDGKIDLVSAGTVDFTILQNVGTTGTLTTSSFLAGVTFRGDNYAFASPGLADFDGDNKPDFFMRSSNFALPAADWLTYIYHNESYPVPRVDSYSPAGGTIGTTVTLTGDYMKTGNGTPLTKMSGVIATSSTPGNTSTTTVVPQGAITGTFTLTEHGLTGSSKPFPLVFGTSKIIDAASFATRVDFLMTTATPRDGLEVADFDDDGKTDVVVGEASGTLKIYQNTHATPGQPVTTSSLTLLATPFISSYNFVALDVDGDGKIDLNNGSGLLRNTSTPGTISFLNGPNGIPTAAAGFNGVTTADLNKDGKIDMVVTNGGITLQLYANSSTTAPFTNDAFAPLPAVPSPTRPTNYGGVVVADFDGDGNDDLAASNPNTDNFTAYRNLNVYGPLVGTNYTAGTNFATGDQPNSLTAGDFDSDGKIDLAVVHYNTLFVSVYRNVSNPGTISFAAPVNLTCLTRGYNIASQDLDGDGLAEIVIIHQPNPGPGSFTVFQNQSSSGTVAFGTGVNTPTPTRNPFAMRIADVNKDQKPDILVIGGSAIGGQTALMVFENRITAPLNPPVITSFTPDRALPGAIITINGNYFGTTAVANTVYLGGELATIITASATQLTVQSPTYASYGPVSVINLTTHLSARSAQSYRPLFDHNKDFGGRIIPASMRKKNDLGLGNDARAITLADMDGDGAMDMIATTKSDSILIFRNKGLSNLTSTGFDLLRIYYPTNASGLGEINATDIDGDGKLDLAIATRDDTGPSSGYFLIFLNQSTPGSLSASSFAAPVKYKLASFQIFNSDAADLTGDGKPELIYTVQSALVWVLKNNSTPGNVNFSPGLSIDLSPFSTSGGIHSGDIDGDGLLDLAIAGGYFGPVGFKIIHNRSISGSLFFDSPVLFSPAGIGSLNDVLIEDMDDDGKADLAWFGNIASGGNGLNIMKNTATPGVIDASSLSGIVSYPWTGGGISSAEHSALADINGDARPDFIVTGTVGGGSNNVGVFENAAATGSINATSFMQGVSFGVGDINLSPQFVTAGDLDGDGKPELVSNNASFTTHVISIHRNECYPAPRIDAIKNSSGPTESGDVGSPISTQGDYQFTNNITPLVRFGAVKSSVTSPTNTAISTTVPSGASHERVSLTDHGLMAFSSIPFNITFPTTGILDATTFPTRVDYSLTTSATRAVSVNDFDNDGNPDIIAGDGGNLRLFRNAQSSAGAALSTSTFVSLTPIATSIGSSPVVAADFDGDNLIDLQGGNFLFHNNSGSQAQPISFEVPVNFNGAINGSAKSNVDFNRDGKTDLVSINNAGTILINENLSRQEPFSNSSAFPTFSPHVDLTAAGGLTDVTAGDFDGDGLDDIVALRNTNQLEFYLNTGLSRRITTTQFGAVQNVATGTSPLRCIAADFNLDGKQDLAVSYSSLTTVSIYMNTSNTGTISFSRQDFPSLANTIGIDAADLDGDGKAELVTIHGTATAPFNFSIFKNTSTAGTIGFSAKIDYTLPTQPFGLSLADLNLDSKADILISRGGPFLSLFQNSLPSGNVITVTQDPADAAVCAGVNATFSMDATGTTNLVFQWQYALTPAGPFADIANGGGYSGATGKTLTVNTAGNFGAGRYRGKISGDFATTVFTNDKGLVINTCGTNLPPVIENENESTVIGGSVSVDLATLISDPDDNLDLSTLSIVVQPSSGAVATLDANHVLSIDYQGLPFSGIDKTTIQVCDLSGACVQKIIEILVSGEVVVYNAVSANGDGKNEGLILKFIEILPETQINKVTVYNRWGDEVFAINDYNNTSRIFKGSSSDGKPLPSGTYFYKVVFSSGLKTLMGYLELKR